MSGQIEAVIQAVVAAVDDVAFEATVRCNHPRIYSPAAAELFRKQLADALRNFAREIKEIDA